MSTTLADLPKKYSEVEYENWEAFKKLCAVRADNIWIKDTCRLTDETCFISTCFAFQLVKLIRGYF